MANYLWIVIILIIFLCIRKKRRTAAAVWQIQNRRKQGDIGYERTGEVIYRQRVHYLHDYI